MRVLVTAPEHATGGQAHAARELVRGFAGSDDVRVDLVGIDPRLPGVLGWLTAWPGLRSLVRPTLFTLTLLGRVPRADVLHVFAAAHTAFLFGAMPPLLVGLLLRRPVVLNYHDGRADSHLRKWGPLIRWAVRHAAVLVVPSAYLREVFAQHGLAVEVVPNVVDVDAFAYRPQARVAPRLISTRLLEPLYAVENTIRAFALVRRERPDAVLDIYGDGVSGPALRRLAVEVGSQGIRFHGLVPHAVMPEVLEAGGILVNSSRVDNMPLTILEALAAGVPVVTTAAGGIRWMVEAERTALVVPFDEPEAMARAILRVLRDERLAARLVEAGRTTAERYRWAVAERGWVRVYRAATSNGGLAPAT